MNDTIVAISTKGVGAISIIRVSGDEAINIVDKVFSGNLIEKESHTINYGFIKYENNLIDEVLVNLMRTPKTYTKEDIVEINCHGGIATTNKILEVLILSGARLAEPGEFTKRAYLNGRIDLTKAEGVMNLINAKTEKARIISLNQLSGKTYDKIIEIREDIKNILVNIAVNVDYPEYEDEEILTLNMLKDKVEYLDKNFGKIIEDSKNGKIINEGIKVAIIGRPNVGKSSILNALIEEDKAIVTDIEGTTRDVVEGKIVIDGILLNIIDTAGIRNTENIIEQKGVEKSKKLIEEADLVIFVLNNSEEMTNEDKEIKELLNNKKHIIVINKIDLESKLEINEKAIKISAKNNEGFNLLKKEISDLFSLEDIEVNDMTYLSSANSIVILKKIYNSVQSIKESINNEIPIDIIEIDIKMIYDELSNIIGTKEDTELVDQMFHKFCLGK